MTKYPTLFIPHGGGPCFFMKPGDGFPSGAWDGMGDYLKGLSSTVAKPGAIVIVSGHWEEPQPALYAPAHTKLLFDYYGFPNYTYQLSYPAKSSAPVAAMVRQLLNGAGFDCGENQERGFDHGVFIPLMLVYPRADVPVVQLSLEAGYDPRRHLEIGRALAPLREQGVLILGSGMSYHNLRAFGVATENGAAADFDNWLVSAVTESDAAVRNQRLTDWRRAPSALRAHPQAEHLAPLFVAAGAALDDPGVVDYSGEVLGKKVSAFRFGGSSSDIIANHA